MDMGPNVALLHMSEAPQLSAALAQLAEVEEKMGHAERDVEMYRLQKTQGLYDERRALTAAIPQFWYIVFAQNDSVAEYVRPEDSKHLERIVDVHVHHGAAADPARYRDFSITVAFGGDAPQQVTKRFFVSDEDGEETIRSEPVEVAWPAELADICPARVEGRDAASKKRYRQGMKSFFAWFAWTGTRPGKEFRSGDDLARLIAYDLFPNAVRYYAEAVRGQESDIEDTSEGEELDVSDDEPALKKTRTVDVQDA